MHLGTSKAELEGNDKQIPCYGEKAMHRWCKKLHPSPTHSKRQKMRTKYYEINHFATLIHSSLRVDSCRSHVWHLFSLVYLV